MIKRFLFSILLLTGQLAFSQGGSAPGFTPPGMGVGGGGGTAPGNPGSPPGVGGGGGTAPGIVPPPPGIGGGGGTAPGTRVTPIDMYQPVLLAFALMLVAGFAYYQREQKAKLS